MERAGPETEGVSLYQQKLQALREENIRWKREPYDNFLIRTPLEHLVVGSTHAGQMVFDPHIPLALLLGGEPEIVANKRREFFKKEPFFIVYLEEAPSNMQVWFSLLDPSQPLSRDNVNLESVSAKLIPSGTVELDEARKKEIISKIFDYYEGRYQARY